MTSKLKKHIDQQYLQELLSHLREATGFGALFIDPDNPDSITPEQQTSECSLCALMHQTEPGRKACAKEFLKAGKEALRWGEPFFYHCYLGLMEWAIPVTAAGRLVGILTCGQVLIRGKDDLFYSDVIQKAREFGLSDEEVIQKIEEVPVASGRKVRAAAELLMLVAEKLSDETDASLERARQRLQEQARIAEIMADREGRPEALDQLHEAQKEIIGLVRVGNLEQARSTLANWLGAMLLRSVTNLSLLKAEMLELVVLLSRAAVEAGGDLEDILGRNLVLVTELLQKDSQEDISHWIFKALEELTQSAFEAKNLERVKLIARGLEFIRRHYQENISLEDVSRAVGRSPSFIKKILREELGLSFTEYLTRIRMEASERYLRNPALSLAEVAQMVGYSDQSYFGKIFKGQYGMTPAQYRKKVV
jgi:two-component system, response regulator YesN